MSKGARAKSPPPPADVKRPAHSASIPHPHRPIPPQRLLLGLLSIVFVAWLAFLVYLYFTTVYPRRSVAPDTSLSAAPAQTAPSTAH